MSIGRRHAQPTGIRQRRRDVDLSALELAEVAKFSVQKVYRIERAPERARLADILLLDESLRRFERAAIGAPGFETELAAVLESGGVTR